VAKRDARKETASKGKSKSARHSDTTTKHKQARVARQERLSARPSADVSHNCRKSRAKRERAKHYAGMSQKDRNSIMSPSEAGERQFGESAAPHHKRS
jgi:hypothetical protein